MSNVIEEAVRSKYASVARAACRATRRVCRRWRKRSAIRPRSWLAIPAEANMGLSCGNPTATANLEAGEVVVDLGSGGGLDVFLAARQVGPTGKAIGIDMTQEMIDLARRNAKSQGPDGQPLATSSSTSPPSTACRCPTRRPTA